MVVFGAVILLDGCLAWSLGVDELWYMDCIPLRVHIS